MAPRDRSEDQNLLLALRHPLRRRILRKMEATEAISPRELSDALGEPLSKVSYHVRVLAEGAVINLVGTKPARGSVQHFYRSAVDAAWARHVLGLGEIDEGGAGESSEGAFN